MVGAEMVKTIPDVIDDVQRIVGEIKDVAALGWDKQLQAQFAWAQQHGYRYHRFIRSATERRGPLARDLRELRDQGIDIHFIEDILQGYQP